MIYKTNLEFPETGTFESKFIVVEKPKGKGIKITYDVSATLSVNSPAKCVLTFDPENGKLSIEGADNDVCLFDGHVKIGEETIKRGRPRKERKNETT